MEEGSRNNNRKRYQIIKLLGEGGMAIVYKAFDTVLERDVAIKVIKTKDIGATHVTQIHQRFDREVKTLARLTHPNIVHIHDYGHAQNTPYLIMEFLAGGTLAERMEKPIPYDSAARTLLPIAEALRYAHQHGILHRDVKPANILFTEDGLPMLSDFGIAKILGEDTEKSSASLTQTGMGIGTPEYMAPEQWHGNFSEKTDMYALGILFYEMLTGRKPYSADTPAAHLIKQMTEEVPPPSQFVNDLPFSVENFILRLLEREPQNRFETMDTVISNLQQFGTLQKRPLINQMEMTDVNLPLPIKDKDQTITEGSMESLSKRTPSSLNEPGNKKIFKEAGSLLRQIMVTLVSIIFSLSIILLILFVYVTGLFSKQAIQNAQYENINREESFRITEAQLNADIDEFVMPYFEDFVEDIDADIKYPDAVNFFIYKNGNIHTLQVTAHERNGSIAFKVTTLDDFPLLFIRGILSSQFTRGMKSVLDEQSVEISDLKFDEGEINYIVRPK